MRKIRRIKITLRRTDFAVKKLFSLIPYQLILYQRIVLISPGIHVGWGDEMEVVEHDVFGCVPRVRGLIVFKSTLVYWGEEKNGGVRSFGEEAAWIGMRCVATGRLWLFGVSAVCSSLTQRGFRFLSPSSTWVYKLWKFLC